MLSSVEGFLEQITDNSIGPTSKYPCHSDSKIRNIRQKSRLVCYLSRGSGFTLPLN